MARLTGSVGRGGQNRRDDVITVQQLINAKLPTPLAPLAVDGICGPMTIVAIGEYQRRNLHMSQPDCRVDPGGATFRSLTGGTAGAAAQTGTLKNWQPSPMPGKRAGLPQAFLTKLDNICGRMKAQGYDTRIYWGVRTLAEQVEIATRGRTFAQFKTFVLAEAKKANITQAQATTWIDYYDPKVGKHPMTAGFDGPVTWTLKSRHLSAKAADVAHPTKGWGVDAAYKNALRAAAVAEGLHIGPPASDWAHVEW